MGLFVTKERVSVVTYTYQFIKTIITEQMKNGSNV